VYLQNVLVITRYYKTHQKFVQFADILAMNAVLTPIFMPSLNAQFAEVEICMINGNTKGAI